MQFKVEVKLAWMRWSVVAVFWLVWGVSCLQSGTCQTAASGDLLRRVEDIAKTAHGKVGVAVEVLETKETCLFNGDEHFPMQSVYKLPIGIAVLHQVDSGLLQLQQMVRVETKDMVPKLLHSPVRDAHPGGAELSLSNLLWQMVVESDGTACDVLLRVLGGPSYVTRYLRELGLTDVMVATTEKEIGQDESAQYQNWTSPKELCRLLRLLQEGKGLSHSSRTLLLRCMSETSTGSQRIKGLLPVGTPVAHKTGSSRTVNGLTRATNDAGIIFLPDGRHLTIVVLISDSSADETTRESVIAKIAQAAWKHWAGGSPRER